MGGLQIRRKGKAAHLGGAQHGGPKWVKVDVRNDAISCHSVYKGDPIAGLKKWAVKADGEYVEKTGRVVELEERLARASEGQWARVMGMDFEELKQRGLEWRCYAFKRLRTKLGLDWRPSKEMRAEVRGKPFADAAYWKFPKQKAKQREHLRKLLDYRLDVYP